MSDNQPSTAVLFRKRERALAAFNRWEAGRPGNTQDGEQVFASRGTIYGLLPSEQRTRESSRKLLGIQDMHRALRHIRQAAP